MTWLTDIQWYILLVIVMKVLTLGAIAAWVISVIAERPCPDYCVYLIANGRDTTVNPACHCLVQTHTRFHNGRNQRPIFYQPSNFPPVPENLYPHPFYIFNPLMQGMPHHEIDIDSITPESSRPPSSLRRHNSEIEINVDSAPAIGQRQEDDVQSDNQRASALYLDINVESDDERSASRVTLTAEERDALEQSLSECANLHALHYAKKGDDSKVRKLSATDNLSTTALENTIDSKCSQISKVLSKNFNEIRESRPKKTADAVNKHGEDEQEHTAIHKEYKQALCTSAIEDNIHTHLSEVTSTSGATTSTVKMPTSYDIYTKMEDITPRTTKRLLEIHVDSTPIFTGNEYPLNTDTVILHPSTVQVQELTESATFADIATTPTNIEQEEIMEKQLTDQVFAKTNNEEERFENRPQYNEGEIPLIKIITHEFSNNTVQSYINGTEDIPNGDFSDEIESIKINNGAENSSENLTLSQATRDVEATTAHANIHMESEGDISGNLYFLFNSHQIPARFVQGNNGSLSLGIDGDSICNRLNSEGESHSALLTTLCNCYKSGTCKPGKSD